MAAESNVQKENRRKLALSNAIESFEYRDPASDDELIRRAKKIEEYYKGES
jgi:hypothetical protein